MDRLWTPWRLAYVSGDAGDQRKGVPDELAGWPAEHDQKCVFCNIIASVRWAVSSGMKKDDAERAALIVAQGETCYVCLNRFPYSTGHVMIVPYSHVDSLAKLPSRDLLEIITTARQVEIALRDIYHPDGLNLGMNLGEAAGAGIADHLHLHELPRWSGDTNFMTTTAETRILPETLVVTWKRLRAALLEQPGGHADHQNHLTSEN